MANQCRNPWNSRGNRSRQAAALASSRVLDSCSDRECLEELQVFFDADDQLILDSCVFVKNPTAVLEAVRFDVEPIRLREGFYTVDMALKFLVSIDAFISREDRPVRLTGSTYVHKQLILFGGRSGARTFYSDSEVGEASPRACIKVAEPLVLSAHLAGEDPSCRGAKALFISLGLFYVASLERPTNLVIPVCDLAMPERRCPEISENSACDLFDEMRFPAEQFI